MTSQTVLDRVRSLVTAAPFYAKESATPFDFSRVPMQNEDDAVRVTSRTVRVLGGLSYTEEVYDDVEIEVLRRVAGDTGDTARGLWTTAQSLTSRLVRDAVEGDYAVPDEGRQAEVDVPAGASYAVLRLTVPVSYMQSL